MASFRMSSMPFTWRTTEWIDAREQDSRQDLLNPLHGNSFYTKLSTQAWANEQGPGIAVPTSQYIAPDSSDEIVTNEKGGKWALETAR